VSQEVELEHVEVVRYERLVRGRTVSRALVRFTGRSDDGTRCTGTGEGRLGAPGRRHAGWGLLVEEATKLEARHVPSVRPGTAPAAVADLLRPLLPPMEADRELQPPGVRQAIELALLDLLCRVQDCDLPTLLGRGRGVLTVSAGDAVPLDARDGDVGTAARVAAAANGPFPVLRLRLSGDLEADLDGVRVAAETEHGAGRRRPLWLLADSYELEATQELLRQLVPVLEQVDLLPPTYVERSAEVAELPQLDALRRAATSLSGSGRVRLAPRLSPTRRDLPACLDGDVPDVLLLDLDQAPSLLDAIDVMDELDRVAPGAAIGLVISDTTSELGRDALAAVAASAPRVDHLFGVGPRDVAPWLTETRLRFRGGTSELVSDTSSGLSPDLDRVDLASFISQRVERPEPDEGSSVEVRAINRYPRPSYAGPFPSNQMFQVEALAGGLSVTRYSTYLFTVDGGRGVPAVGFERGRCDTSEVAQRGAWSKHLTKELLASAGFSVPSGATFAPGEGREAAAFGRRHGFPLVVKPVEGRKGIGITTGIDSGTELDQAIAAAEGSSYGGSGFIVERFVTGADYRVLVLGDKVLSVVLREPAHVVGDGRHTIAELVTAKNLERRRNHHLALGRMIEFNADAARMMALQGHHGRSIPAAGETVVLRSVSNQSAGGESTEVLDDTHPSILELAVRAVAAVPGLVHAGLDVLLDDHTQPVEQERFDIIEVNDSPAMGLHHWVMFGRPRNVTRKVVGFYARRGGLDLLPRTRTLAVRLSVEGSVVGVGYRAWLAREAEKRKLDGWVANTAGGEVRAVLAGRVERVSSVVSHAIRGPASAFPVRVRCVPEPDAPAEGFTIREAVDP
jgi:D-alanine-D-alanine ligase-like ATP-grasp enzyme/acylphosphatase